MSCAAPDVDGEWNGGRGRERERERDRAAKGNKYREIFYSTVCDEELGCCGLVGEEEGDWGGVWKLIHLRDAIGVMTVMGRRAGLGRKKDGMQ